MNAQRTRWAEMVAMMVNPNKRCLVFCGQVIVVDEYNNYGDTNGLYTLLELLIAISNSNYAPFFIMLTSFSQLPFHVTGGLREVNMI